MTLILKSIIDYIFSFVNKIHEFKFEFFDITVSLIDILCALLIFSVVISVFWKGAKG